MRTESGYALLRGRPDSLVPELWANGLGYKQLPVLKANGSDAWRCDRLGCVARMQGAPVAFPSQPQALLEDCAAATLVVSPYRVRHCDATLLAGYGLAYQGVHAFWWQDGRWSRQSSADWQGRRPWGMRPAD